ncbi:MAG TPA: putative toxin-antitoxin system toxin component, PIN family [Thermodesulfobacteriota bacterium]|nr:putative toxin-antitoxin system toxin component, PIN family [Thermodesulfobacteriota bacterium]
MGKKPKKIIRVVLDTNVLISGLLVKGKLSKIVALWQKGKIVPLISKETFEELRTVLEYPQFSLSRVEIKSLIEHEILPYFEVVNVNKQVKGACRDPGDDKFISCAISANADGIVTGDKDLSDMKKYQSLRIIHLSDFIKMFD